MERATGVQKNALSKPGVLKQKRSLNPLTSVSKKETVVRSQLCGKNHILLRFIRPFLSKDVTLLGILLHH